MKLNAAADRARARAFVAVVHAADGVCARRHVTTSLGAVAPASDAVDTRTREAS